MPRPPAGRSSSVALEAPPRRGIRIIGAGHPRTGTQSLEEALRILGYRPCLHSPECEEVSNAFVNESVKKAWLSFYFEGADFAPALQSLLDRGIDATVGHDPQRWAWRELVRLYPDAKVILSVHPGGSLGWVRSEEKNSLVIQSGIFWWLEQSCKDQGLPFPESKRAWLSSTYESYNAEVRATVPPERLLEFSVAQGWGPLCAFLDRPEPGAPFPYIDMQRQFRRILDGVHPDFCTEEGRVLARGLLPDRRNWALG